MSNQMTVLWVYIALLFLGGLMGFIKAGSKASLIASSIFAAVLILFALNILPFQYHWIVLAFGRIFWQPLDAVQKMMPNGVMFILTDVVLLCQLVLFK